LECLRSKNNEMCYDPRRVMEHHGDYQCREEEGGLDCLSETVPDGYGKLVTTPLQIEGDMNDVRACNSEPIEYYYQVAARWVPKVAKDGAVSTLKPMNFYNFIGPGVLYPPDQSSLIATFPVPTGHASLYWYTGRMPHGGEMLRNKMHVHNKVFKEYMLIKATPAELGLTKENNLMPTKAYGTVNINAAGYSSLAEVKAFVLKHLKSSQEHFDGYSDATLEIIENNYKTDDLHSRDRPEVICQSIQDLEEVDGYYYDRKVPTCCNPWHIKRDDIYTVVGLNPKLEYALGPHTTEVPDTFPAHVSMWMSWANEDEPATSQFGIQTHTQVPSGFLDASMSTGSLKIAMILNGGAITDHQAYLHDYWFPATIILTIVSYPATCLGLLLLFLAYAMIKCYSCLCKKAKNDFVGPSSPKRFQVEQEGTLLCPDPEAMLEAIEKRVTGSSEAENIRNIKNR
jgi:hypothetical protein